MKTTIISVGSATEAVKAKHCLSNAGFKSRIIKRTVKNDGCNFALEIRAKSIFDLAMILRSCGIEYTVIDNDIP